jgi:hypothetical protein
MKLILPNPHNYELTVRLDGRFPGYGQIAHYYGTPSHMVAGYFGWRRFNFHEPEEWFLKTDE